MFSSNIYIFFNFKASITLFLFVNLSISSSVMLKLNIIRNITENDPNLKTIRISDRIRIKYNIKNLKENPKYPNPTIRFGGLAHMSYDLQ